MYTRTGTRATAIDTRPVDLRFSEAERVGPGLFVVRHDGHADGCDLGAVQDDQAVQRARCGSSEADLDGNPVPFGARLGRAALARGRWSPDAELAEEAPFLRIHSVDQERSGWHVRPEAPALACSFTHASIDAAIGADSKFGEGIGSFLVAHAGHGTPTPARLDRPHPSQRRTRAP